MSEQEPPVNPPQPAPPPVAEPPQPTPPPKDWKGSESAWVDLWSARQAKREAISAREAAENALQQARQQWQTEQQTLQLQAQQAQSEASSWQTKYERDTAVMGNDGVPDSFRHPAMLQRLWNEYEQQRAGMGDNPTAFRDWLTSDGVKSDPLYAPHFASMQQPDPNALPELPAPPSNDGNPPAPPPPGRRTGTPPQPQGRPVVYDNATISRLRSQGLWKAGRVDTSTGEPIGGSPHWQAWVRQAGS